MGLRRTGLGLRSLWRLCLRGTAKEFVRLRCCYSPKVWAGVDPECGDFAGDERGATIAVGTAFVAMGAHLIFIF